MSEIKCYFKPFISRVYAKAFLLGRFWSKYKGDSKDDGGKKQEFNIKRVIKCKRDE